MLTARFAEYLYHTIGKMAGKANRSIGQNLHALIAAQRLEVTRIQLKAVVFGLNNLRNLIPVRIFPIRREAHDFAFVTVLVVANEFANHGVNTTQRMRKKDS